MATVHIRTEIAGIPMEYSETQLAEAKVILERHSAKHECSTDKSEVYSAANPKRLMSELEDIGIEVELLSE